MQLCFYQLNLRLCIAFSLKYQEKNLQSLTFSQYLIKLLKNTHKTTFPAFSIQNPLPSPRRSNLKSCIMSDKIVQEFIQRLNRTKSSLADAERQCEFLKKEASKLESVLSPQELASKEYEQNEYLRIEDNLKVHYISSKVRNEEGEARQSSRGTTCCMRSCCG